MKSLNEIVNVKGVTLDNNIVRVDDSINESDMLTFLKEYYDYQSTLENKDSVKLNIKKCSVSKIIAAFKYSITRDDLCDSLMILNIINLIKTYNTLEDSYFENDNIYVNSIEDLLDIKLDLQEELKDLINKISIYFISLLKSYNKTIFTPIDDHKELPEFFKIFFLNVDFMTICGILTISDNFNTEKCTFIDDSYIYVNSFISKCNFSNTIMSYFMGKYNND